MIGDKQQTFFTVKDLPAKDFIEAFSQYLKKNNFIERPAWVDLVKTSTSTPSLTQKTNSPQPAKTGSTPELPLSPEKSTFVLTPESDFSPTCTEEDTEEAADLSSTTTLQPRSSDGDFSSWRNSS